MSISSFSIIRRYITIWTVSIGTTLKKIEMTYRGGLPDIVGHQSVSLIFMDEIQEKLGETVVSSHFGI